MDNIEHLDVLPDDIINFAAGWPNEKDVPLNYLKEASDKSYERFFNNKNNDIQEILQYAAENGSDSFIKVLIQYVNDKLKINEYSENPEILYNVNNEEEGEENNNEEEGEDDKIFCNKLEYKNIKIVQGGSYGLFLCANRIHNLQNGVSIRNKNIVCLSDPTYFLAEGIFTNDCNYESITIPTDENGMKIELLEERLLNDENLAKNLRIVYTIPTFHNPTSTILSVKRRKLLLKLSKKYNFLILSDEVYNLLHFQQDPPLPPLFTMDYEPFTVVTVSSFSKLVCPGIRCAYLQADEHYINILTNVSFLLSGGNLSCYNSSVIEEMILSGNFEKHRAHLIRTYKTNSTIVYNRLLENFPLDDDSHGISYTMPLGGYYVCLYLPKYVQIDELNQSFKDHKINIKTFDQNSTPIIRLCIANIATNVIQSSVDRVIKVIKEFIK